VALLWDGFIAVLWKDSGDSGDSVSWVPPRGISLEHCWARRGALPLAWKGWSGLLTRSLCRKIGAIKARTPQTSSNQREAWCKDGQLTTHILISVLSIPNCFSLKPSGLSHISTDTNKIRLWPRIPFDLSVVLLSQWYILYTALGSGKSNSLLQKAVRVCTLLTFGPQSYSQFPYPNLRIRFL